MAVSFEDALRREFMERIHSWLEKERPELLQDCGNDTDRAVLALGALEDGRVIHRDLSSSEGHGGRLWFLVGGDVVMGAAWWFRSCGTLESLDWYGFDPLYERKKAGRATGGRRYHPITGEILN